MPRSCSSAIQSEVAWREVLRDLTEPAIWIAPPNSSSFSVRVVLPASGCEMIAKVRRRAASAATSGMAKAPAGATGMRGGCGLYGLRRRAQGGWRLCSSSEPGAWLRASRPPDGSRRGRQTRSAEQTNELQALMRITYDGTYVHQKT